jgi:hypothetical protein
VRIITSLLLFAASAAFAQTRDYPKLPPDDPIHAADAQRANDLDRAAAPYIAKARKSYPAAKKRFLAGLPPRYLFSITTKLWDRSHTRFEVVFVVADKISDGKVFGRVASQTSLPVGRKFGDRIAFPETEIMDWTIVHPDGREEGNVVGKFMESHQRR